MVHYRELGRNMFAFLERRALGYVASIFFVAATTLALSPYENSVRGGSGITVATVLLTTVIVSALLWGTGPGLVAAILGTLCLNVFYRRPERISSGELIGFASFLLTSILVGQLSSKAHRRAREVQELYDQLRTAFDRASQLEAAKRSEQFKSSLLDTVTHDLRTPLTSIKAAATALIQMREDGSEPSHVSPASQGQLLDVIVQQSDRLNEFIEGMIELAKIEAGAGQEDSGAEPTALEEIIAAALGRAEDVLRKHQVHVTCGDDLYVAANPKALVQVLFSLLENAARHAPQGTVIRVIATRDGLKNVQVAVEDEGPGVPEHLREKIFERFFRGDGTLGGGGRKNGLGFGLAIAGGIVRANGGRIWEEDRPGELQGARFVFTVPAKIRTEPDQPEQAATP